MIYVYNNVWYAFKNKYVKKLKFKFYSILFLFYLLKKLDLKNYNFFKIKDSEN
jgi:hypothetical protein